jgi:hypothetical protein
VRWTLALKGGRVVRAEFQWLGCPHTESVLGWLQTALPGRSVEDLVPGGPLDWASSLGVPAEKLGRLLIIEDALRACVRHHQTHDNFTH